MERTNAGSLRTKMKTDLIISVITIAFSTQFAALLYLIFRLKKL